MEGAQGCALGGGVVRAELQGWPERGLEMRS